jgi:hypothetical protein
MVSPEGIEPSTNRLRVDRRRSPDEVRSAIMGLFEAQGGQVDAVHATLFAQNSRRRQAVLDTSSC